jgi:hypothetical protein
MAGKASKTNMGQSLQEHHSRQDAGSHNVKEQKSIAGTIIDISYPDTLNQDTYEYGIRVKILFDNPVFNRTSNVWYMIKNSYEEMMSNYGTRESIVRSKPRVMYHYISNRFDQGYAEIITDNKEERKYDKYTRNSSSVFVNTITGFAYRSKPIG